jgi:alpha-D-xyloside xylohydrolase
MAMITDPGSATECVRAGTELRVQVAAVAEGILRVCFTAGGAAPRSSELVLNEFTRAPARDLAAGTTMDAGSFVVRRGTSLEGPILDVGTGGDPLLTVASAQLTPVDLVSYDTGGEPPDLHTVRTVDGERTYIRNLVPHVDGQAWRAEVLIAPRPGEGHYGLGQDEDGALNRRGTRVHLYQHNMRIPMPCLVSDAGYGILLDTGSLLTYDDTGEQTRLELDSVDSIDLYVVAGGAEAVVRGFRRLTGRAPLLPKWAFGFVQSRERYETADELVEVAHRYRELDVPIDGLVQDWKSWPGEEWGQKTVDPQRFPDLAAMKQALSDLDVHSMVSVWPNMASGCPDHEEFAAAGLLLGDYSTYDAFDSRGRDLYWKQLRAELFGAFDSWWCDSTEPFSAPDWQGSVRLGEDERAELVGGEHVRYLGAQRANLYALAHARGIYEHELAEQEAGTAPVRRVLNLTRSGYPGIQRYGAVLWSGDVSATWRDLRAELSKVISMGLCGVPWWTTDAGAFFVGGTASWRRWCGDPDAAPVWFWRGDYDDGVADPAYRELYTRWLQFGSMLAMFRSHGTDTPREIWNFGEPGEPVYDAIAATIRLRYRLLPYVYTVAAQASLCDTVMVRGLLFDFADDPVARTVADEFMLGEALLVCPVLEEGARRRSCYLPAGAEWCDFWTGTRHHGGSWVEVDAPLDRLPLFVRAGCVLVEQAPVNHALQNRDAFEVLVHPGADGTGRLYDDDGLSHAYSEGDYTLVEFTWDDANRRLRVAAASWRRDRPLTLTVRLGGQTRDITFDGNPTVISFEETP